MNHNVIIIIFVSMFFYVTSCSQSDPDMTVKESEKQVECSQKNEPHKYGGWYCPDNLKGFPAVDFANWNQVPTINDRMPTEEEVRTESSLIYVDPEKYPNAEAFDLRLPRLASYFNYSSNRKETIIVIQAFHIDNDSIVGFRFLNGGNGSARLNEIELLSDNQIKKMSGGKFVTETIDIHASPKKVFEVITDKRYLELFLPVFGMDENDKTTWRTLTNINYNNSTNLVKTASFANELYGMYYVQNDYCCNGYSEKILLFENQEEEKIQIELAFGPYTEEYAKQEEIIKKWLELVKKLSEEC